MSRSELAACVNEVLYPDPQRRSRSPVNANYIGKLEDGVIHWPKPEYRAALRTVLGVGSDKEIGFYNPRAVARANVEDVDRRDLLGALGSVIGVSIASPPAMALLGREGPSELPHRVGRDHIEQVIEAAEIFEKWDNSHGGALAREVADSKLRQLAKLLERPCPPSLKADLHAVMAQLAGVVAFMLFDAYEHASARKRFTFALQCAEIGGHWQHRATLLANMARQAIWCGQPEDGLTYTELGLVRADRLTATERAMLHTVRARALAKFGPPRAQEALTAVGAADEEFACSRSAEDPSWMRFYDAAQHHGDTAHALYDIAVRSGLKTEASSRFRFSVSHHEPEFARSRAISRTKLASLTMLHGDPDEAAQIGQLALDDAGTVRSRRAIDDLRELHRLAFRHDSVQEVHQLRARIDATVGAAG
ncbi:hypothetical protein C1I95_17245 [Micromonospora craterilacus]|uniref:Transcriptional regulator n=1 Tax=Micromonospora craterilacus TaxID=1655439 RepID=A0A2W2ESN7_9ACTN|nr:hypothetical protein [Micromonospora craterilacus]PZG16540.1 hypothetical protein C1I95_17245 [Micromonospora craterilacus]